MPELFAPAELEVAILASLDDLRGKIPQDPTSGFQSDEFRQDRIKELIKLEVLDKMTEEGDSETKGDGWKRRTNVFGQEGSSLLSTEAKTQEETPRRVGIVDGVHTAHTDTKFDRITSIYEGRPKGGFALRRIDILLYPEATVLAFNDFTGEWHGDDPGVGFTLDGKIMTSSETRRLRNR